MVSVSQADNIVLANTKDFGVETLSFEDCLGRVLAEDLIADRDLPPYNRVAMDGIAIVFDAFQNGIMRFKIAGTQAAGDKPIEITDNEQCVEIMTGAALPDSLDTIIRYEDVKMEDGFATILIKDIRKGQNIHCKGIDKKQGEIVVRSGAYITPAVINMAASVGKTSLAVKKNPKVVIITTGDEVIAVDKTPSPYEVRQSNNYAAKAVLQQYSVAAELLHIVDDAEKVKQQLANCLSQYDAIILSGGISMGKFDYVPQALQVLQVEQLFYKVQQRPGKPFWFGKHGNGTVVFAFPGNPVSTFMCLHRYFIPWLKSCWGLEIPKAYAILNSEVTFAPPLQYFMQVKLRMNKQAQLVATPTEGHGSGDFANLLESNAFMELPAELNNFKQGEIYPIWTFSPVI
ncbi:MAG: molybdopterin molybdotransferase MoeA [Bacteroidetes bacterium]|nr:molybdopterin molybdotransferase MoeA [Bacteroidota bacterium]